MTAPDDLRSGGQRIWLDDISRSLLDSGRFEELRSECGVSGVTANPTIYARAVKSSTDYDETIRTHRADGAEEAFWHFAVADIRMAADVLAARFADSAGMDGLVSLEISPRLAYDAEATIAAGKRLFDRIDRPNAMVKVPGTRPGIVAIEELTAAGVNVNVTLLFGPRQWEAAWSAYTRGIERRLAAGGEVDSVVSVASFFLSRIDAKANPLLPVDLRDRLAVAVARAIYEEWSNRHREQWPTFDDRRARAQQLLWASTSPKSDNLTSTHYAERLNAPMTVITLPIDVAESLCRLEGISEPRLDATPVDPALEVLRQAAEHGAPIEELAEDLQQEGVDKFNDSFSELLEAVEAQMSGAATGAR